MPLALLAPIFLAAGLAVAVPLLVHLVHKEKREAVAFPSFMFLRKTPYPFSARQRLRDVLLFLARCALISLAALAFARPVFTPRSRASAGASTGTEHVILLDRSFSMRYGDRWAKAKQAAAAALSKVSANDRVSVVAFDRVAQAANDGGAPAARVRSALDSVSLSDEGTRYAPAVAVAARILGSTELPNRHLLVISDFQRSGWDLTDDVSIPPGTRVETSDVSGPVVNNSIRSVEVRRDAGGSGRVAVSARVVRLGRAVRGVTGRLEVAGREVARVTADLPGDGGGTLQFGALVVPERPSPARVVLSSDALPGDDVFHFLLSPPPRIPVLVVEHRDAPPERGLFVSRALSIGDDPSFDAIVRRSDRVTAADLVGRRVVILNDAGVPAGLAQRLDAFVRAGGGLVTALGERSMPRDWPSQAQELLPGRIAAPTDRLGARGAVLGDVDRRHPVLSVFSGARSGDLSAARFFRYRPLEATEGVLARFDDGSVALAEQRVGRGTVLTFASSFDGFWNDLPRQPVFLPFLHQLVRHAAGYRQVKRALAVGESIRPHDLASADTSVERWSAVAPSGQRTLIGGPQNPAALALREAGFYQIRPSGSPGAEPILLASNIAPAELDFATFDPLRLSNALTPVTSTAVEVTDPRLLLAEREQRQRLWWYILTVAACMLGVEGVLAVRASRNRLEPV